MKGKIMVTREVTTSNHPLSSFDAFIAAAKNPASDVNPVMAMLDAELAQNRAAYLHTNFPRSHEAASEVNTYWQLAISGEDLGYIYFLEAPDLKRIKVGFSRDVNKRVAALRNGSPCDLVLVGTVRAVPAVEYALHRYLAKSWVFGEWFHYDELVANAVRDALTHPSSSVTLKTPA